MQRVALTARPYRGVDIQINGWKETATMSHGEKLNEVKLLRDFAIRLKQDLGALGQERHNLASRQGFRLSPLCRVRDGYRVLHIVFQDVIDT